jgi:hypothetical protein
MVMALEIERFACQLTGGKRFAESGIIQPLLKKNFAEPRLLQHVAGWHIHL